MTLVTLFIQSTEEIVVIMTTAEGLQQVALTELNLAIGADVDAAVAAVAGLRLLGYSVRESHGTAAIATLSIVNGATGAAAGKIVFIELAANKSETVWFGPQGIACPLGLSVDWVAGLADLTLHYIDTSPGN